jgi:hypothetical protein
MSLLYIAVRLRNLFQRIALIYGGFYLPRLDQSCEEDKVFDLVTCGPQTRHQKSNLLRLDL